MWEREKARKGKMWERSIGEKINLNLSLAEGCETRFISLATEQYAMQINASLAVNWFQVMSYFHYVSHVFVAYIPA